MTHSGRASQPQQPPLSASVVHEAADAPNTITRHPPLHPPGTQLGEGGAGGKQGRHTPADNDLFMASRKKLYSKYRKKRRPQRKFSDRCHAGIKFFQSSKLKDFFFSFNQQNAAFVRALRDLYAFNGLQKVHFHIRCSRPNQARRKAGEGGTGCLGSASVKYKYADK